MLAKRRFRIRDAFLLISAFAVAFFLCCNLDHWYGSKLFYAQFIVQTTAITLTAAITFLVLVERTGKSARPITFGRLTLVLTSVCFLSTVVFTWYFPFFHGSDWVEPPTIFDRLGTFIFVSAFESDNHSPAYGFVTAIVVLRLGLLTPQPRDWIDYAGISLGAFWLLRSIVLGLIYLL